ncbi:MAG: DegV family protein [Oscillospiraceae bacterium]|nr:DegV family protein [Oscillospiraceae bacterium]
MAIHIVADSTCDLTEELIEQYHITILPLYVMLGDKDHRDGKDITAEDIFRFVAAGGALPKTAAVTVEDYLTAFRRILERNPADEIICITISAKFSSCYQNACIAAEETGHVTVIDSMNLSTGIGHVILTAAELIEENKTVPEIAEILRNDIIPNVDASFIIDRLDYLHKGGRCSAVAALGANLLKLKPCIEVRNGEMSVSKKYRGNFVHCVTEYAKDRLAERDSIDNHRIFITHAAASKEAVSAAENAVRESGRFEAIVETQAGSTISSHCGPNTLGVLFVRKK